MIAAYAAFVALLAVLTYLQPLGTAVPALFAASSLVLFVAAGIDWWENRAC